MQLKDNAPAATLGAIWKDDKGKTAKVQPGSMTMESSDPNLLVVTGDEASGFQRAVGPLDGADANADGLIGDPVRVTVRADADLGDGVKEVIAVGTYQIIAGDASVGTLTENGAPVV